MEQTTQNFDLQIEFNEALKEVQTTQERHQQALGRLAYIQELAKRLQAQPEQTTSEQIN